MPIWLIYLGGLLQFGVTIFLTHWVVKELLTLFPTVLQAVDRKDRAWVVTAILAAIVWLLSLHR